MTVHNVQYTTPADGTNLLEDYAIGMSNRWRKLMKVGFIGGAAIADGHLKIYVGSKVIVDMRNCAITDTILPDAHILPVGGEWIPPRTQLIAELVDGTGADDYTPDRDWETITLEPT